MFKTVWYKTRALEVQNSVCHHLFKHSKMSRFREDTPEILKVKEKEKGDWKKLSVEEKKLLYR